MNTTKSQSSKSPLSLEKDETKLLRLWSSDLSSLSSVEFVPSQEDLQEEIKEKLKGNYKLTLFSALPKMSGELKYIKQLSAKLGLSSDECASMAQDLLRSGLWQMKEGMVVADFDFLDLGDFSLANHLSMTLNLIASFSDAKYEDHRFDFLVLATNRDLIKKFMGKVNNALSELFESSQQIEERNCLFSWNHNSLIEVELKRKQKKEDDL